MLVELAEPPALVLSVTLPLVVELIPFWVELVLPVVLEAAPFTRCAVWCTLLAAVVPVEWTVLAVLAAVVLTLFLAAVALLLTAFVVELAVPFSVLVAVDVECVLLAEPVIPVLFVSLMPADLDVALSPVVEVLLASKVVVEVALTEPALSVVPLLLPEDPLTLSWVLFAAFTALLLVLLLQQMLILLQR